MNNLLRVTRERAGLSQRQLADISGVDFTLVSRYERGQITKPSWQHVYAFAQALNIPPEKLFPQKPTMKLRGSAAGAGCAAATAKGKGKQNGKRIRENNSKK